MNAITPFTVSNKESPIFFDVYERPVYFKGSDEKLYESPDHKAIVRMFAGEPLQIGMVGQNYKVLKMKELCEAVETELSLSLSPQEIEGVQVHDRTSYHGGLCFRQYVFPKIAKAVNERSTVAFRIVIINGYDGSSSFKLYSGAIDFFCSNGMVTGSYDLMVARHTSGLTVPKVLSTVKRTVEVFYKQADIWKKWANKQITLDMATACFASIPNVSEKRVQQLLHLYEIEVPRHGNTVWAMYSAATFYASHDAGEFTIRDTGTDHRAATLLGREKDVMKWQETEQFLQIAA